MASGDTTSLALFLAWVACGAVYPVRFYLLRIFSKAERKAQDEKRAKAIRESKIREFAEAHEGFLILFACVMYAILGPFNFLIRTRGEEERP